MNFISKLLISLTLITFLFSCSDSTNDNGDTVSEQIKIRSSVKLQRSDLQNVQIEEGQIVGFKVIDRSTNNDLYKNVALTADGTGGFDSSTAMYYPTNGSNVNFYAYHPYSTALDATETTLMSFSVQTDQNLQDNYLASDVLYSEKLDVKRTNDVVPLVFLHKMSKLSFTILKGDGVDISGLKKIEILDVLPDVDMELLDGTLSLAKGDPVTITAFNVKGGESTDTTLSGSSAIIAPQTIASKIPLLKISIDNVTFTYSTEKELEFESGKNYQFQITVNMGGIEVESSIVDWDFGGNISGGGVMD